MRRKFEVGGLAKVVFDPGDSIPNLGAKKYDGTIHRIIREVRYGTYGAMFELEGCVSDQGVPYTFTKDELEVIK
jgi:hypothetical protein